MDLKHFICTTAVCLTGVLSPYLLNVWMILSRCHVRTNDQSTHLTFIYRIPTNNAGYRLSIVNICWWSPVKALSRWFYFLQVSGCKCLIPYYKDTWFFTEETCVVYIIVIHEGARRSTHALVSAYMRRDIFYRCIIFWVRDTAIPH